MKKEKFFGYVGWVGMCTSVLMYVFYFPQIQDNLGIFSKYLTNCLSV